MTISLDAANALESAIDGKIRQAATPRRRASGTVSRVDKDGTVYAVLESGIETVVEGLTASVSPGDTVSVTVEDGHAEVLGNYTDPSAGVAYVRKVEGIATEAGETANAAVDSAAAARQVADEANKVAQATNQHFFADTNGAHITDVTQDEWAQAVADNFSDYDPDTKPYHNQLLNSLGILLRTALNNLVSITRSAIAFYDGTGNTASNIVARFGSAGAQIGQESDCHVELDADSLNFVSGNSVPLVTMRIDPDSAQYWEATFTSDGTTGMYRVDDADRFAITPGTMTGYAVLINGERTSKGAIQYSTTGGVQYINGVWFSPGTIPEAGAEIVLSVTAAARASLIVGSGKTSVNPNVGNNTIIAGNGSFAGGDNSIAVGYGAGASGNACAAFGTSRATADYAFAAGGGSEATRLYAVALGYTAYAHAAHTVAIGRGVNAKSENQTVFGKYNENDTNGDYALIIGNGTSDIARSNALAVKWDGTLETAQDIPWTELTLASGWTAYSTARTPMYRRVGSMVEVRGAVKPTAETSLGTSSVTFGNLPPGCRPVNMEVTAICQGSGVKEWLFTVDTDGNVCASRMRTMNSTAYQSAGTSEFMVFDVSFLAG